MTNANKKSITEQLFDMAHKAATAGDKVGAETLTRAMDAIEHLQKEVNHAQVMSRYHEECKQLAEDKLRQHLLC